MSFCLSFVPYSHYDEPEILPHATPSGCFTLADAGHVLASSEYQVKPDKIKTNLHRQTKACNGVMKDKDVRDYPRAKSGVQITFSAEPHTKSSEKYFAGIAENYSFGGLFLATDTTFPPGTLVNMELSIPGQAPIFVKAVVVWQRRFFRPKGIGLKFVEFENIGDRDLDQLLKTIFENDGLSPAGSNVSS